MSGSRYKQALTIIKRIAAGEVEALDFADPYVARLRAGVNRLAREAAAVDAIGECQHLNDSGKRWISAGKVQQLIGLARGKAVTRQHVNRLGREGRLEREPCQNSYRYAVVSVRDYLAARKNNGT